MESLAQTPRFVPSRHDNPSQCSKLAFTFLMSLIPQVTQGQILGAQGCLCQLSQNHTHHHRVDEAGKDLWRALVLQSLFRDCMSSTAPLIYVTPEACRWLFMFPSPHWGKGWRQSQQARIEFKAFWWTQVCFMPHPSGHTSPEDFRRGKREIDLLPMYLMVERAGKSLNAHTESCTLPLGAKVCIYFIWSLWQSNDVNTSVGTAHPCTIVISEWSSSWSNSPAHEFIIFHIRLNPWKENTEEHRLPMGSPEFFGLLSAGCKGIPTKCVTWRNSHLLWEHCSWEQALNRNVLLHLPGKIHWLPRRGRY